MREEDYSIFNVMKNIPIRRSLLAITSKKYTVNAVAVVTGSVAKNYTR